MGEDNFYITTAIAYANAKPHMGHALEFVQADCIARYMRLLGCRVRFQTGMDEHGVKQAETAAEQGLKPQELADKNAQSYRDVCQLLSISFDNFIRTTDREGHWPACQKLWQLMADKGDIYKQKYTGIYCAGCEKFLTDRDMEDGKCPIHTGMDLKEVSEENYFFKLSRYSEEITRLIESDELKIHPEERKNEILSLAREGLKDVSFSRPKTSLEWGIPVPGDPSQVIYVWCDALSNYISGLGYVDESDLYRQFWPAKVHCIGKDILRFHAGIWPGILLSAGVELPKAIFVHGFITSEGQKMGKSLGNVVDPVDIVDTYGTEALRYYLLKEIPSTSDGDFSLQRFEEKYNADLANDLGNLLNRTVGLIRKYRQGRLEAGAMLSDVWGTLPETSASVVEAVKKNMLDYQLSRAIEAIWKLVRELNLYVTQAAPWTLKKEKKAAELDSVLYALVEGLRLVSLLVYPFLPTAANLFREQLGLPPVADGDLSGEQADFGYLTGTIEIKGGQAVFPRLDRKKKKAPPVGQKKKKAQAQVPEIAIEDFSAVDLRVAEVLTAEPVKDSRNLLQLSISLGEDEPRQLVAGIAKCYTPEQLVGRKIVVVANLKPARIMGVESRGMLLAAGTSENLGLLLVDRDIPVGTRVK
ncbi:MAG: methionine--tRNA ligase [bacterium]|nr:methionine--tRNA ligase [bacterium]